MTAMTALDTEKADLADDAPHLLVVDDDKRVRELLGSYLRQNGFQVTQTENGAAARAQLEGLAFDCIILDVMMPGENGFEVAEWLRKESDVPILMLTAKSEPEHRIKGLDRRRRTMNGKSSEATKPGRLRRKIGRRRSGADGRHPRASMQNRWKPKSKATIS